MFLPPSSSSPSPPDPPRAAIHRRSLHDRIVEVLHYLSDEVDTRRVGGLGEAQAAGYVAGRLRRADYAASVLSFRAGAGEKASLTLIAVLGILAGTLGAAGLFASIPAWLVVLAMLLVVATIGLLLAEVEGAEPLRRVLRGTPSQSVVAGRAATSKQTKARVVVLAPLDGPPHVVLDRRGLLLLLGTLIVEAIALSGVLLADAPIWRMLAGGCALLLLLIGLWIVSRRALPVPLPAIHGAGELAALLLIAEELTSLTTVEVWMIALGGGSVGHESVRALTERYPFSLQDTWFINLHAISVGQPVFVTREGRLRERRSHPALLALATDIDAADVTIDAEPRRLRQRTLAQSVLRLGFRTITISSHNAASPFTSPDATTIERCVRLVVGMIRGLDR